MGDKTTIVLSSLLIALVVGVFIIAPQMGSTTVGTRQDVPSATRESTSGSESTPYEDEAKTAPETPPLPVFTKESLAQYDGADPSLPIYLAFEGNVYDVTEGKRFYEPGGAYHFLAGTDGTPMLRIAGGGIIKEKYPVVGTYVE
jgi:predicted heme/steroid binding protein